MAAEHVEMAAVGKLTGNSAGVALANEFPVSWRYRQLIARLAVA